MGLEHATDNHELKITGITFIGYSVLLFFSFTGLCFLFYFIYLIQDRILLYSNLSVYVCETPS